jgi:hypothetical protein
MGMNEHERWRRSTEPGEPLSYVAKGTVVGQLKALVDAMEVLGVVPPDVIRISREKYTLLQEEMGPPGEGFTRLSWHHSHGESTILPEDARHA